MKSKKVSSTWILWAVAAFKSGHYGEVPPYKRHRFHCTAADSITIIIMVV